MTGTVPLVVPRNVLAANDVLPSRDDLTGQVRGPTLDASSVFVSVRQHALDNDEIGVRLGHQRGPNLPGNG